MRPSEKELGELAHDLEVLRALLARIAARLEKLLREELGTEEKP
jgi:hypothetical protein